MRSTPCWQMLVRLESLLEEPPCCQPLVRRRMCRAMISKVAHHVVSLVVCRWRQGTCRTMFDADGTHDSTTPTGRKGRFTCSDGCRSRSDDRGTSFDADYSPEMTEERRSLSWQSRGGRSVTRTTCEANCTPKLTEGRLVLSFGPGGERRVDGKPW